MTDPVAVGLARAGSALAKIDDGELRSCSTQQRFANRAVELAAQEADLGTFFDTVIVCRVTCSSHAGMIAGFALEDRNDRRVIGIDASATPDKTFDQVTRIATNTAEVIELRRPLRDDEITVIAGYERPAFGVPDQQTVDAIHLAVRTEGMLTDPVYEGKSMAGLIGMIRSGEGGAVGAAVPGINSDQQVEQRARKLIDMWRNRILAAVTLVGALVGPSGVAAAPIAISGPVTTVSLARAVRVNPPAPPAAPAPLISPILLEMLDRVNAERSARGLAPFTYDDRLILAAQRHSDDQASRGRTSHTGSDGSTLAVRIDRIGYSWSRLGENVAHGFPDAASVVAAWMASPEHRANILSVNTQFGLGLALGMDGRPYWTQVFATPG